MVKKWEIWFLNLDPTVSQDRLLNKVATVSSDFVKERINSALKDYFDLD